MVEGVTLKRLSLYACVCRPSRGTFFWLYACVRKPSRDTMLDVCERVVLGDGVVVSGDSYILWIHFGIYIPIPDHRVCKWSVLSLAFLLIFAAILVYYQQ